MKLVLSMFLFILLMIGTVSTEQETTIKRSESIKSRNGITENPLTTESKIDIYNTVLEKKAEDVNYDFYEAKKHDPRLTRELLEKLLKAMKRKSSKNEKQNARKMDENISNILIKPDLNSADRLTTFSPVVNDTFRLEYPTTRVDELLAQKADNRSYILSKSDYQPEDFLPVDSKIFSLEYPITRIDELITRRGNTFPPTIFVSNMNKLESSIEKNKNLDQLEFDKINVTTQHISTTESMFTSETPFFREKGILFSQSTTPTTDPGKNIPNRSRSDFDRRVQPVLRNRKQEKKHPLIPKHDLHSKTQNVSYKNISLSPLTTLIKDENENSTKRSLTELINTKEDKPRLDESNNEDLNRTATNVNFTMETQNFLQNNISQPTAQQLKKDKKNTYSSLSNLKTRSEEKQSDDSYTIRNVNIDQKSANPGSNFENTTPQTLTDIDLGRNGFDPTENYIFSNDEQYKNDTRPESYPTFSNEWTMNNVTTVLRRKIAPDNNNIQTTLKRVMESNGIMPNSYENSQPRQTPSFATDRASPIAFEGFQSIPEARDGGNFNTLSSIERQWIPEPPIRQQNLNSALPLNLNLELPSKLNPLFPQSFNSALSPNINPAPPQNFNPAQPQNLNLVLPSYLNPALPPNFNPLLLSYVKPKLSLYFNPEFSRYLNSAQAPNLHYASPQNKNFGLRRNYNHALSSKLSLGLLRTVNTLRPSFSNPRFAANLNPRLQRVSKALRFSEQRRALLNSLAFANQQSSKPFAAYYLRPQLEYNNFK